MPFFRNISIRRKLALTMTTASGLALGMACVSFVTYEYISFRNDVAHQLESMANIIGANSTAALSFDDRDSAREILAALRFQKSVAHAWLFDTRGKVFAEYGRKDPAKPNREPRIRPVGIYYDDNGLWVYQAVRLQGSGTIGTVILHSNLEELYLRIMDYVIAASFIAALAVMAAFLIGRKLQQSVVTPILDLADVARKVSQEHDYSVRARKATNDELGTLVSGFNEMLTQIQQQDQALRAARDELEDRVRARTMELEKEIEQRTRAQQELNDTAEELSRSNRELEQFAYAASHDLQEPLRKVQAFGDRLCSVYAERLDDRGRDYIARMQNAACRMQTLINDLLTFSRVTTKVEPFTSVDLNRVIRDVLSDMEVSIEETGAKVETGTLPTINADPTQMRQVFQNLIGNALKYRSPERSPLISITARSLDANHRTCPPENAAWWEIMVQDNGIGFDQKYAERVFEVFQRLHGRGQYEGSGVGLAVVRKIITRHQGVISARSSPGKGACFIINLKGPRATAS